MFGSISNWINNNLPQTIPPVNIPNINMPQIFTKKNETSDQEEATNPVEKSEETSPDNKIEEKVVEAEKKNSEMENPENEEKSSINPIDTAKEFGNSAKEFLGNTTDLLGSTTSNFGNMLFSFSKNASDNVIKTATQLKDAIEKKTLIGDFNKENEKFVNEKKLAQRHADASLPPWVGYNEEEKLKEQILALSTDSRNFTRSPPVGVDFDFDLKIYLPIAMATLEEDSNLKDMRFQLVPGKINEEAFWRNYFYRVSLIKQSTQLESLDEVAKEHLNDEKKSQEQISSTEFVSDSYDQNGINEDEIKNDLKQLKLDNKKLEAEIDEQDWDKDLPEDLDSISAEELEKEINQMIQ
ncbi:synapse-associated 1-like [Brachionus plicatilis]|uniref:Synapse-associated 1-like n=1 Tax=Brachionus plicatilis TaxID=10195 RepID=A0A3M7S7K5_BRAPC|nr:synapse-associated 1-like [Brachionus plicatilis]